MKRRERSAEADRTEVRLLYANAKSRNGKKKEKPRDVTTGQVRGGDPSPELRAYDVNEDNTLPLHSAKEISRTTCLAISGSSVQYHALRDW